MKITRWTSLAAALALVTLTPSMPAQDPAPTATPTATPNGAPPPGAPSRDRMEQFRQRINEFLKTSLKATDEEWAVIEPLLEKVEAKQREAMTARFSALGGGRRGGHPDQQPSADRPNRPAPPSSGETDALKAALESESTSPADIKAKLEAVRTARKKAAAELEQAREDLRKVLTQRQEATLVMVGILE
ncbi:MAG: hypothetical protein WCH57_10645 [Verrucomicrobiota bacterium]